ncbi:MAG: hypothetical protein V4760_18670, partial [Bdellovibrionota bacterium]
MSWNHRASSAMGRGLAFLTVVALMLGHPSTLPYAFAQTEAASEVPPMEDEPMLDPADDALPTETAPEASAPATTATPAPAASAPEAAPVVESEIDYGDEPAVQTEPAPGEAQTATPAAPAETPAAAPVPAATEMQTSEAAEAELEAEPAPTPIPTTADGIVNDPSENQFKDEEQGAAPVADSKALEESGLSNPVANENYKRPLLFAPEDNGLKLEYPQIKWEMLGGTRINMGGLKMQNTQIGFNVDQTRRTVNGKTRTSTNVSFSWPEALTSKGVLTIETGDQKVKWRQAVTPGKKAAWKSLLKQRPDLKVHQKSLWGITNARGTMLKALSAGGNFRMCLVRKASKLEQLRVCSGYLSIKNDRGNFTVTQLRPKSEANVYVAGKPAGPRGLLNFAPGRAVRLRVAFNDGSKVEIASQPAVLNLLDVVESKDGREIILTGTKLMPLGKKKIISRPERHFWSATGIEQETIWQIAISQEAPTVRVLGTFSLPFTFVFNADKIPKEIDRVYIREGGSGGTYSEAPVLFGHSPNNDYVLSREKEAHNTDPTLFEWTFNSPEFAKFNRSRITIKNRTDQTKQWVAHHRLFRGYPYEASTRLTGVLGATGQMVILGEVSAGAWFESLGFTQNNLISKQRWGAAARYFRSLTSIDTGNNTSISEFTSMNIDLKYNILRGIWNRDEMVGAIMSAQSVTVNGISGTLFGGGAYWARTMPKVFADLFDLIPYLDYSKYVDMELIVYPLSFDSNVVPGVSYNLNFHGKVFWTKRIYGEMGFGIKRFDYGDKTLNSS